MRGLLKISWWALKITGKFRSFGVHFYKFPSPLSFNPINYKLPRKARVEWNRFPRMRVKMRAGHVRSLGISPVWLGESSWACCLQRRPSGKPSSRLAGSPGHFILRAPVRGTCLPAHIFAFSMYFLYLLYAFVHPSFTLSSDIFHTSALGTVGNLSVLGSTAGRE